MSRVGLNPITIEEGVQVSVEKNIVTVSGDGKELNISFPEVLTVEVKDNVVQVNRKNDEKQSKSVHGTIRMLISNAINGVKNGFEKKLELFLLTYSPSYLIPFPL